MHSSVTNSSRPLRGALGADVQARGRRLPTVPRAALTSAATFDWGSSHGLQRLAAAVLAAAATNQVGAAIDLDCATSAYWHRAWCPQCRPAHFFDGSTPSLDALDERAWGNLAAHLGGTIGAAYCNPPGEGGGAKVKAFWAMLEVLLRRGLVGSLCWTGFNLDQARSLIPNELTGKKGKGWILHPLGRHKRVITIFPGRRIPYLAQPEHMMEIIGTRLTSKRCKGSERARLIARYDALRARTTDAPVPGPSPTHASYVTIVLSAVSVTRIAQIEMLRAFLDAEQSDLRSVFAPCAVIGAYA